MESILKKILEEYLKPKSVSAKVIHEDFKKALNISEVSGDRLYKLERIGMGHQSEIYRESVKMPYKAIYKNQAIHLCEKYGLLIADLDDFIGNIPDKNLDEVNYFMDKYFRITKNIRTLFSTKDIEFKSWKEYHDYKPKWFYSLGETKSNFHFKIIAPKKDLNLTGKRIVGSEVVDDPIIVAIPNKYARNEYWFIITAWGDEAKDEIVFNERNN